MGRVRISGRSKRIVIYIIPFRLILLTKVDSCGLLALPFFQSVHQVPILFVLLLFKACLGGTRNGNFVWSPRTLVVTLAFICLVVLGLGAARKGNKQKAQIAPPRIESFTPLAQNMTRSLELAGARRNRDAEGGPELSLRNGADKAITALAVSVNGVIAIVDFLYSEDQVNRSLAPGAVHTNWFASMRRSLSTEPAPQDFDVKILAVVFDDRSGEGEERPIAGIFHDRNKSKRLLTRIANVFSEEISGQTADGAVFETLRSRISSVSSDPADSRDIATVLRWLDQSDSGLSYRERLKRVMEACENLRARL